MMRHAFFTLSTLALCARCASAGGGINLSWDDCGPYGSISRTFACNTNAGTNVIVCSAIAPVPMSQFIGMAATIELVADQPTLPSWWSLDAVTGCRGATPSALSIDLNFVAGPFNCRDLWAGNASGGLNYVSGGVAPNRARLRMVCAVPS